MSYSATYISANSFSVPTDKRAFFIPTSRVAVDCSGTFKYSSIVSASFGSGVTTVVLRQSVLTNPCGDCFVFPFFSGPTGNIPFHTHLDDDTGGSEVVGQPPSHEISGSEIRFKNPDGSWGDWIDLRTTVGFTWEDEWS